MLPGLGFVFVGVPVFDRRIEEIDERSVVLLVDATGVPLVDEDFAEPPSFVPLRLSPSFVRTSSLCFSPGSRFSSTAAAWSTAVNGGLGGAFTTGTEASFGCSRSSLLLLLGCRSVVSGV